LFSISCSDWLTKLTGLVIEQFANSVFLSRVFSNTAIRVWDARGDCIPDILLYDCLKESVTKTAICVAIVHYIIMNIMASIQICKIAVSINYLIIL